MKLATNHPDSHDIQFINMCISQTEVAIGKWTARFEEPLGYSFTECLKVLMLLEYELLDLKAMRDNLRKRGA